MTTGEEDDVEEEVVEVDLYQAQARSPARTVARRKESYHARSRRPPREDSQD